LVIPLRVGAALTLAMVPNTAASRSVITPVAFTRLQGLGLVGPAVPHIPSGMRGCVLRALTVAGHPLAEFEVQIRDVDALRTDVGESAVDGYLGLDFFFANFAAIRFELKRFRLTLEF
jgi:hypothetical protein